MAPAGCSSSYVSESNVTSYYPIMLEQQQPSTPRRHLLPKILLGGGCFLLLIIIFIRLFAQESTGMTSVNGTSHLNTDLPLVTGSLFPEKNSPEQSDANSKSASKQEPFAKGSTIEPGQVDDSTRKSNDSAIIFTKTTYEDFCPRLVDKTVNFTELLFEQIKLPRFIPKGGNMFDQLKKIEKYYKREEENDKIYFSKSENEVVQRSTKDSEIIKRIDFQWSFDKNTKNQINSTNNKPRKKVILTLSLLDNNDFGTCSKSKLKHFDELCEFITDQSRFEEADVVIFREEDLKNDLIHKKNRINQLWVYNNPSPLQASSSPPPERQILNVFNLTATYDLNSHLPILPMYWSPNSTGNWVYKKKIITDNQPRVAVYNKDCSEENMFLKKYKNVIEDLTRNGVTVNWFGNCNQSKNHQSDCKDLSSAKCYEKISTKYKFALAFETTDVDFISERFFDPLSNYVVPIVIGNSTQAKYKALSPVNSFIDFCSFKTVADMINSLKLWYSDESEYNKFFTESGGGGSFKTRNRWYCQVCGMLFR